MAQWCGRVLICGGLKRSFTHNPSIIINQGGLMMILITSAGSILIEIEESTILAQFFRIEIVKKSIFEYLPKSLRIGIE